MSDVPFVRDELERIAAELGEHPAAAQIGELIPLLRRKKHKPVKARSRYRRLDADTKRAIRDYVAENPTAQVRDVANMFGTNQGRVTEALMGDAP